LTRTEMEMEMSTLSGVLLRKMIPA